MTICIKVYAICPVESYMDNLMKTTKLFNTTCPKKFYQSSSSLALRDNRSTNVYTSHTIRNRSIKKYNATDSSNYCQDDENLPIEKKFLMSGSPHLKDPDCKLDMVKS